MESSEIDTREVYPLMLPLFPTKPMFSIMKTRHLMFKKAYPDKGQGRDFPFKNIEKPRPETIKASKPRIDRKKGSVRSARGHHAGARVG